MSIEERVIIEPDTADSPSAAFNQHRHRCCFQFPCFGSSPSSFTSCHITLGGGTPTSSLSDPVSSSIWDRFRSAENEGRWWSRPFTAFKKIREWSEIVAGPKWKTFIRRINRRRPNHHHHQQQQSTGKFQYDPLSYALNFDEGPGQNGHFDEDHSGNFPDFSTRYAALSTTPLSSSGESGNGAPAR